jgi:hypothetical protein
MQRGEAISEGIRELCFAMVSDRQRINELKLGLPQGSRHHDELHGNLVGSEHILRGCKEKVGWVGRSCAKLCKLGSI